MDRITPHEKIKKFGEAKIAPAFEFQLKHKDTKTQSYTQEECTSNCFFVPSCLGWLKRLPYDH